MKKVADIINAVFFHLHLAFSLIVLLILAHLYSPPFNDFNILIIFAVSIVVQLISNAILYAVSGGFDKDVNFKKHNLSSLALFLAIIIILCFQG